LQYGKKLIENEIRKYKWVQLSPRQRAMLEGQPEDPLEQEPKCIFIGASADGMDLYEYHIDQHPKLIEYVDAAGRKMHGGSLPLEIGDRRPIIEVGQDELVYQQYTFSAAGWKEKGKSQIRPKGDGDAVMLSVFFGPSIGFGQLDMEEPNGALERINAIQKSNAMVQYVDQESAQEVFNVEGTLSKETFASWQDVQETLCLTFDHGKNRDVWYGKPKGMVQVLWERGFIDETQLDKYRKTVPNSWKNEDGSIKDNKKEDVTKFVLSEMLAKCEDFATEITHLEHLVSQISDKCGGDGKEIMFSPKCHCELAGLGIEYGWGLSKRYYRRMITLGDKKKDFKGSVRLALEQVTKEHARRFCYKTRWYAMAYIALAENNLTDVEHAMIEKFVRHLRLTILPWTKTCSSSTALSQRSKKRRRRVKSSSSTRRRPYAMVDSNNRNDTPHHPPLAPPRPLIILLVCLLLHASRMPAKLQKARHTCSNKQPRRIE
jgi:hypothetical protein